MLPILQNPSEEETDDAGDDTEKGEGKVSFSGKKAHEELRGEDVEDAFEEDQPADDRDPPGFGGQEGHHTPHKDQDGAGQEHYRFVLKEVFEEHWQGFAAKDQKQSADNHVDTENFCDKKIIHGSMILRMEGMGKKALLVLRPIVVIFPRENDPIAFFFDYPEIGTEGAFFGVDAQRGGLHNLRAVFVDNGLQHKLERIPRFRNVVDEEEFFAAQINLGKIQNAQVLFPIELRLGTFVGIGGDSQDVVDVVQSFGEEIERDESTAGDADDIVRHKSARLDLLGKLIEYRLCLFP